MGSAVSKKQSQDVDPLQFSLEEIIAEVKSDFSAAETERSAAGSSAPEIKKPEERNAASGPPSSPPPEKADGAAAEKTASRREPAPLRPKPPERESSPVCAEAPWRTRPKPALPEETREPEAAPPPAPKRTSPALNYDFTNVKYEDAAKGADQCLKKLRRMTLRLFMMFPILGLAMYLSFAPTYGLPLPPGFSYLNTPYLYVFALCAAEIFCMLLCPEITAAGIWRLMRLRPTMDSLVAFSCLTSLVHAVTIIVRPQWGGWLPYNCVSCTACFLALLAKRQRVSALRRTYKLLHVTASPLALKAEDDVAFKSAMGVYADPVQLSSPDMAERLSVYYAPLALVCAVVFAFLSSFGQKDPERFFWALSALGVMALPFAMLFSSAFPRHRITKKLFSSGCALVSDDHARTISRVSGVLLTDGDLFPPGSVKVTGMKIASTQSMDKVIGAAASALLPLEGGLSRAFSELAKNQFLAPLAAKTLSIYESGGLSAEVGGNQVLIGNASFLMRMGIRFGDGFQMKNGIYIAINSAFAGVFSVQYQVTPQTYVTFRLLKRLRIRPILAARDFNVTPSLIDKLFHLRPDGYAYPDAVRREQLSLKKQEESGAPVLALMTRDSALPFAEAIGGARRMRNASRFNLACSVACGVIGLMQMYFLVFHLSAASATPALVLGYQLSWLVPVILSSILCSAF